MPPYEAAGVNRLRLIFADKVLSLGLPPDATFADIADALSRLSLTARQAPVSIDVTLAKRGTRFDNPPVPLRQKRSGTVAVL